MDEARWQIKKLGSDLIAKIAAGEVVERPASAIKELVENSIDAGATAITVEIRDGGIPYFRVSDNGHGIEPSQIKMAFERSATSKLKTESQLYEIATLGFRGEALASIAAVSRVTCLSRVADSDVGVKATVEAGEFTEITDAASPVGTSITVRDLFFNTPVRLKFLRKPAYEAVIVSDYMVRLILSRPDVAFRFVNQGKTAYQSPGDGRMESAVYAALGREALRGMRPFGGHQGGVIVSGYVGVGELARGNRQSQSFFINGRFFRSPLMSKAVERACEGGVMVGKYPSCVIYLQIPYDKVDVNVHPNKLEVRFQNTDAVLDAVEAIIRDALAQRTVEKAITQEEQPPAPPAAPSIVVTEEAPPSAVAEAVNRLTPVTVSSGVYSKAQLKESTLPYFFAPPAIETPVPEAKPPEQTAMPEAESGAAAIPLRYVGALFRTYLIFESGERVILVDQHAAHERVLYERLMESAGKRRLSQQLLSPKLVEVSPDDMAALIQYRDALTQSGLEFEVFDDHSVAVRAVPSVLGASYPLGELLPGLIESAREQRGQVTAEKIRMSVATMACKRAIKAGDELPREQAEALVKTMLESGTPPQCPHGRPIVVETTRRELEKRFKRIQ